MSDEPFSGKCPTCGQPDRQVVEHDLAVARARIVELEAELALLRGTPGSSPTSETLTEYTHDVPPDAPR